LNFLLFYADWSTRLLVFDSPPRIVLLFPSAIDFDSQDQLFVRATLLPSHETFLTLAHALSMRFGVIRLMQLFGCLVEIFQINTQQLIYHYLLEFFQQYLNIPCFTSPLIQVIM